MLLTLIEITSAGDGFERLLQDAETPPRGAVESVERAIRDREEAGERTEPSLLEHWADKEIAELGFAPEEVALLRRSKADNLLDVKGAVEFTNEPASTRLHRIEAVGLGLLALGG